MSHPINEAILERHFEDALKLNRLELITELGRSAASVWNYNSDELAEMVANKRFAEGPDGPC